MVETFGTKIWLWRLGLTMTYSKLMYTAKNSQVQKIWKQMGMKKLFVVMGRGREGMEIIPSLLFLVWEEKGKWKKKIKSTFINN